MKRFYLWLMKHDIGVFRFLYLSPLVALLTGWENFWQAATLLDLAISITYLMGNQHRWYEEVE